VRSFNCPAGGAEEGQEPKAGTWNDVYLRVSGKLAAGYEKIALENIRYAFLKATQKIC